MKPPRIQLIIDTDGGIDDAVAIFFAATDPNVNLVAVTVVHGNVAVEQAGDNVLRVLEAADRSDVPVALGASEALGPVPSLRRADFIHGTDGLGNTHRPQTKTRPCGDDALSLLVGILRAKAEEVPGAGNEGQLKIVTLGPLSNIAGLVSSHPDLLGTVSRLVVMGGTVLSQGNALPFAEANIAHDPTAAQIVVAGAWREPPLLVGLDVTHQATLSSTEQELVGEHRTAASAFLDVPLSFYGAAAGAFCEPGTFPCHDLLAVMAAVYPIVEGPVLPLSVQVEQGPAWGATIADRRVPYFERAGANSLQASPPGFHPWQIGLDVDVEEFRRLVRDLFGG